MSVTQGQLSGAPSRPASPAASAVNENCSSLPASPELPEQASSPLGSDRSPLENSPWVWGLAPWTWREGLPGPQFLYLSRRRADWPCPGVPLSLFWPPDL